jgi:hypothetical protein
MVVVVVVIHVMDECVLLLMLECGMGFGVGL